MKFKNHKTRILNNRKEQKRMPNKTINKSTGNPNREPELWNPYNDHMTNSNHF